MTKKYNVTIIISIAVAILMVIAAMTQIVNEGLQAAAVELVEAAKANMAWIIGIVAADIAVSIAAKRKATKNN